MKYLFLIISLLVTSSTGIFAAEADPQKQFELGLKYEHGKGVKKDFSKALELYLASASTGYARAQSTLGYLYLYGEGVEQDLQKAFEWNTKAAEQGDPYAQLNLGVLWINLKQS